MSTLFYRILPLAPVVDIGEEKAKCKNDCSHVQHCDNDIHHGVGLHQFSLVYKRVLGYFTI